MRSEAGFTLTELVVAVAISTTVMLGAFALVDVAAQNSTRIASRVDANQRARPVMQRVMDELHSTCLRSDAPPVLAGSTSSSLSFLHQVGPGVAPAPEKHVITYASATLTEQTYQPDAGSVGPNWTFSTAPTSWQLLTGVGPASMGTPPSAAPVFQYYAGVNGALSTTPLPVPLTAADAAKTVQVRFSFSASPSSQPVTDPASAVSLSDSAFMRFSPFSEDPTKANGPCQ